MPVAVVITLLAAVAAWAALALWQGRLLIRATDGAESCPTCAEPLVDAVVEPGQPPRSYQVRHCTSCRTVITSLHGSRSAFAYCPSCRQLALQLHAPPAKPGDPMQIEVSEECQVCAYRGTLHLRGGRRLDEAPPDNVIEFPGRRR